MTRTISSITHGTTSKASTKKKLTTQSELKKLKSLLPTLNRKPSSSPMEIVLETIRYIRELEDQLIDRFQAETLSVPLTPHPSSLSDMSSNSSLSTDSSTLLRDIGNSD